MITKTIIKTILLNEGIIRSATLKYQVMSSDALIVMSLAWGVTGALFAWSMYMLLKQK
jgi:hypothetical protein